MGTWNTRQGAAPGPRADGGRRLFLDDLLPAAVVCRLDLGGFDHRCRNIHAHDFPELVTQGLAQAAGAAAEIQGAFALRFEPEFAEICAENDFTWIGPGADVIRQMGDKATARTMAVEAEVPVVPGTGLVDDEGANISAGEKQLITIARRFASWTNLVIVKLYLPRRAPDLRRSWPRCSKRARRWSSGSMRRRPCRCP